MAPSKRSRSPFKKIRSHVAAVALGVVLTLVGMYQLPPRFLPQSLATNEVRSQVTEVQAVEVDDSVSGQIAQVPAPTSTQNFVASAVDRVGSAVVLIDTQRVVTREFGPNPFFNDPFFRQFFGDQFSQQFPQQREFRQRGQGSGFIVDGTGIVLTNAHVVSGADIVTVNLRDGRTFQGEVRGADETLDLAVVKIEGDDLPVAPLGRSERVRVGDWAIAVGNPLGLDNTVTLGIVSTLNRSSSQVGIPDKRIDFIQTDAAINPGNSGGPLLNERGEVIGINTAIRADAEGIGFAIPIDAVKEIQDQLARGETIPHPFIGIRMAALTPEIAKEINEDPNSGFQVPEVDGILVVGVAPGSPAAAGGVRRGDVITDIDGEAVSTGEEVQRIVENSEIGEPLEFTVRRGDRTQQLTVRPGELQEVMGG
ncbi:MAG: HhoA/HhoB/HtrA family serine endopeptidase [Cyanobacteria bacterium J06633_2]